MTQGTSLPRQKKQEGLGASLLDTQTGKSWTWTKFSDVKDEPNAWKFSDRLDTDLQMYQWGLKQGFTSDNTRAK